jgi:NAD(P)-dependent dehydrogenase (short-subunit alcohol dehydrogenase family)
MSLFKNKNVLITGSEGLIGWELTKSFLNKGYNVIGLDLKKKKKKLSADLLKNYYFYKVNIANENNLKNIGKKIKKRNGLINIIVNNAATKSKNLKKFYSDTSRYPGKTWREVIHVNLFSMQNIINVFVKDLIRNKGGSIIQISSIYGACKGPDERIYRGLKKRINVPPVYSASKAGVVGLSKHYAAFFGKYGIRTNAVVFGGVFFNHHKKFVKNYSKKVPLNRMAMLTEVCGPVLFLAEDGSSYINGQQIIVDGGMSVY